MFCCSTHNLFSPSVQSYFFLTPWKGKTSSASGLKLFWCPIHEITYPSSASECDSLEILLTFL